MGKFCIIEARVERLLAGVVINVEGKLASYIQYNDTNRNRIYLADYLAGQLTLDVEKIILIASEEKDILARHMHQYVKINRAKIAYGLVGPLILRKPFANTTSIFSPLLKITPPNRRHFFIQHCIAPTKVAGVAGVDGVDGVDGVLVLLIISISLTFDNTKQSKAKQNKTKQNKTKQNKTQNKFNLGAFDLLTQNQNTFNIKTFFFLSIFLFYIFIN
ncbi:hypothetical protein EYC80_004883 [Monilinia laxa]|uniref:Uncharacterized protein n=1 Tax=Monilinia laxa TaxID=61186 RepID=A0A5N6KI63_MONLA|nr:hypothetical protein EYC80_004883 [Monilinia laxa]